jgi:hypothetical protein
MIANSVQSMTGFWQVTLEVTADELLGMKTTATTGTKPSLKVLRRLKKIEELTTSFSTKNSFQDY